MIMLPVWCVLTAHRLQACFCIGIHPLLHCDNTLDRPPDHVLRLLQLCLQLLFAAAAAPAAGAIGPWLLPVASLPASRHLALLPLLLPFHRTCCVAAGLWFFPFHCARCNATGLRLLLLHCSATLSLHCSLGH